MILEREYPQYPKNLGRLTNYHYTMYCLFHQTETPPKHFRYSPNLDCVWNITTDPGYFVEITFDDMEMEEEDCKFDYVAILEGKCIVLA